MSKLKLQVKVVKFKCCFELGLGSLGYYPTTLSTHVWDLKQKNKNWSIDGANHFESDPVSIKCRLCLKEKYHIIFQPTGATLNQRSKLYSTCRHILKQTLANTNLKFSGEENFKLEGSRTPLKMSILICFLQNWLIQCLNFPNLKVQQ
jgi:hypothetical protein